MCRAASLGTGAGSMSSRSIGLINAAFSMRVRVACAGQRVEEKQLVV